MARKMLFRVSRNLAMRRRFQILMLLAALLPSTLDASEICAGFSFLRRTGTPSCWVRAELGPNGFLCFSYPLFRAYLDSNSDRLCASETKNPRVYSPGEQDQGEKKAFTRIRATSLASHRGGVHFKLLKSIEDLREEISQSIRKHDKFGVFRKLILYEKIPESPEAMMRALGFVHLYSTAGIHLYALSGFVFSLAFVLLRSLGFGTARGWQGGAYLLGYSTFLLVWLLNGMRAGMLRPLLVIALRFIGRRMGFRWNLFAPLSIVLGVDMLIAGWFWVHSESLWGQGRSHYALAVAGGLAAIRDRLGFGRMGLMEHVKLSVGSWLPTAFYDIISLGLIAPLTPIISLITIPIFGSLYFVLSIGVVLGLDSLSSGLSFIQEVMNVCLDGLVSISSLWILPVGWVAAAGGAGILLWLHVRGSAIQKVGICFVLFSVTLGVKALVRPSFELWQLDVGQGDAAFVQESRSVGLIDVGSYYGLKSIDWIHFLAKRGVTKLDYVLITHPDEDHVGGLRRLFGVVPIGCVRFDQAHRADLKDLISLGESFGTRWSDRDDCFPYRLAIVGKQKPRGNGNDIMLGTLIPTPNGGTYLNFGDADSEQELELINAFWAKMNPPVVLKMSHHGSKYSSDSQVLERINPDEVWISSGVGNPHGHPHIEVLDRLKNRPLRIRRTDREGAIRWSSR